VHFVGLFFVFNILHVLRKTPRHTDVWDTGVTAPHILNIITTWRWVVSFTPQKFYQRKITTDSHLKKDRWDPEPIWTFGKMTVLSHLPSI